jgi:hypothetical protein
MYLGRIKGASRMTRLISLSFVAALAATLAVPAAAFPMQHPTLPTVGTDTGPDGIVKASIRCRARTGGF